MFGIALLGQFNVPHPDQSPLALAIGIETKHINDALGAIVETVDAAIWFDLYLALCKNLARVWNVLASLCQIAAMASVKQIVVFELQIGTKCLGVEVFDVEHAHETRPH